MSSTVIIAESDHLNVLKERSEFSDALSFTDTETPKALEAILRHKPSVVVIEKVFATKSRGAALINRIKADPSLTSCEIRIVAHDSSYSRVSSRKPQHTVAVTVAVADPPPPPLDQRGTRRAPRHKIIQGIEVTIDGNPAMLIDLSTIGAQVVSAVTLKPNQRVRLSFPEGSKNIRFNAGVAWSAFELPKGEARYRAGIEFFDADADAVGRFVDTNKTDIPKK
jgi:hypothetical protein